MAVLLLLAGSLCLPQLAFATPWAGRSLVDIIEELRGNGLTIIYSSQLVAPDLKVTTEPVSRLLERRLQEVLKPFGLEAQPLGNGTSGFAVVRSTHEEVTHQLAPSLNALTEDEITIYGSVYRFARPDRTRNETSSGRAMESTAGASQDALHAVHNFAGTASSAVSTLTHVRGGNEDETLIQFDGVELYEPVHLKDFQGLFGVLDPEAIRSLNFFGGGYPVRYGNHTAGLIDIEPRHGEQENVIGTGLLYSRALSIGSFNDQRGDWLIGYRRSSIPEVLHHLKHKIGDPNFEDFVGRMAYEFGGTKITIGLLRLNDYLKLSMPSASEQASGYFHDTYWWARVEHPWNDSLSSRLQVSQADLRAERNGQINVVGISNGVLSRTRNTLVTSMVTDWNYSLNTASIQWGARADRSSLQYSYTSQANFLAPLSMTFGLPPSFSRRSAGNPQGNLYSAYVSARKVLGKLTAEAGLRWDDYDYIDHGKTTSPRIHLQYEASAKNIFHFSVGRYVQARSASNLDISTVLLAARSPEVSEQFALGFDHLFADTLRLRIETYSKHNENVRPYSENVLDIITLVPELRVDRSLIAPQQSSMRGVEVSVASLNDGAFNWWANYTYSEARDRIRGIDIPRSWDQPHAFNAGVNWSAARWKYSANYSWHSGWPFTPLKIQQTSRGEIALLAARNSQRFEDYSSLDVHADYSLPMHGTSLDFFFELRNVFDQANDCCRTIRVNDSDVNQPTIYVKQKAWTGWIPIIGLDWRF